MKYSHNRHNNTCRRCSNPDSPAQQLIAPNKTAKYHHSTMGHSLTKSLSLATGIGSLVFCAVASAGSMLDFINPFSANNNVSDNNSAISAPVNGLSTTSMNTNQAVDLFYHSYNDTRYMDNETMESSAAALYNNAPVDSSHNDINHQWLNSAEPDEDTPEGSRALGRVAQNIFKTYWRGLKETRYKDNDLVPDSNGTWDNDSGVDYNVRMTDDEIKFRLSYDF